MRFCLMSCKKFVSHNTGKDYFKAIVYDFESDNISVIFIKENVFSFLNENNLLRKSVDDFIVFKFNIEKQAYMLSFDIDNK
jgi:hypothetical protein